MPRPIDAYREGYERGSHDTAGGRLGEITMGVLRDDPGGHFVAGYRDGAAGNNFNPPSDGARRPAAELNPFDDKVAIKVVCPNCGGLDWFEWKFLGKLTDPVCGHSWYAGSGTYTVMQIRAAFSAGGRLAKYFTSGVSGEGAWIGKILGWFLGVILGLGIRLEFGVLMIPIQALVGLFQPRKSNPEIAARVFVLAAALAAIGAGYYETHHASRLQFQQVQPFQPSGFTPPASSPPPVADTSSALQPPSPPQAEPVPDIPDFQRLAVPDYRRYNLDFLRLINQDRYVHLTKALGWIESGFEVYQCVAGGCIHVKPVCEGCVLQVKAGDAIYESHLEFGSTSEDAVNYYVNSVCGVCGNKGETLMFRVSPNSTRDELVFLPPTQTQ